MPEILVLNTGGSIFCQDDQTLLDVLLENGLFVNNPCGGKAVCGKCKVRIAKGDAGPVTDTERKLLTVEELARGIRLACVVRPRQELTVELLEKERKTEVLTKGYIPEFIQQPGIGKRVIQLQRPTLEDQVSFEAQLKNQLQLAHIPLHVLAANRYTPGTYTAVLWRDTLLGLESGDTTGSLYGVAVDIGTTTVVTALIDLTTGRELANTSMVNAQKHYGLDVLTRITYEMEHPDDGVEKLQTAIVNSLNEMIGEVCQQARIDRSQIYEITVGANCTMMHMLLGVDAASIGKAPYAPMFFGAQRLLACQIGLVAAPRAQLYCLPSVSSYIGADIVAGAYVCELEKAQENVLFIDIGTNGEIVLSQHGKLMSCSCAAGPALEGMNISSGMRAAPGAVEDVKITPDGVELAVIGDQVPIGLCGSGILAVVRELLRTGIVLPSGAFVRMEQLAEDDSRRQLLQVNGKKREVLLQKEPTPILVTQKDVRQVQLAKGAILSGFYALLHQAGIDMAQLDRVMIAGQFGAHLPADSLIGTGILPEEVRDKLVYVGNTSKTGAYMALMSEQVKLEMEALARKIHYMELSATENYERLFSNCLIFPES